MEQENKIQEWKLWHGLAGNESWTLPGLVAESDKSARADQGNHIKANEFMDTEEVLNQKLDLLAQFVRLSQFTCAYTGAGLSKSSGIPDYASKSKESVVQAPKLKSNLDAEPTYAHCVLTAMERAGLLHHCVQQNHDGLPQKSGFPPEKINEIHGAWYDPSNPVVQFNESLRSDLFDWMLEAEQRVDLCLCLGTSLSGMNADRMAKTPAKRSRKPIPETLGTVVVNLQQTPLDCYALIRIWAKLDDAFRILAQKLELGEIKKIPLPLHPGDVYEIPYNAEGYLDPSVRMVWDLRMGVTVMISIKEAMNYGALGSIAAKRGEHYSVHLEEEKGGVKENVGRLLGVWWVDAALRGAVLRIPLVNVGAVVKPVN
jgi:NAD-dependent SIR2 family protein deacetylase